MIRRLILCLILAAIVAGVGSCSYGWRYVVVNQSLMTVALEYHLRPDSADACPACQHGFSVPKPRWITRDSTTTSGYCWRSADSTEYTVAFDGRDLHFQLSVPAAGMVEIYEHTSLDDYRHIPFRLITLQATSDTQRVSAEGELLKRLFRKQAHWYALLISDS
jgi:hypothetical protein